jgi:hypothetical protein
LPPTRVSLGVIISRYERAIRLYRRLGFDETGQHVETFDGYGAVKFIDMEKLDSKAWLNAAMIRRRRRSHLGTGSAGGDASTVKRPHGRASGSKAAAHLPERPPSLDLLQRRQRRLRTAAALAAGAAAGAAL